MVVTQQSMEESKKSKKEKNQLLAQERRLKLKDKKLIEELIEKIGTESISFDKLVREVNKHTSYNLTFMNDNEN